MRQVLIVQTVYVDKYVTRYRTVFMPKYVTKINFVTIYQQPIKQPATKPTTQTGIKVSVTKSKTKNTTGTTPSIRPPDYLASTTTPIRPPDYLVNVTPLTRPPDYLASTKTPAKQGKPEKKKKEKQEQQKELPDWYIMAVAAKYGATPWQPEPTFWDIVREAGVAGAAYYYALKNARELAKTDDFLHKFAAAGLATAGGFASSLMSIVDPKVIAHFLKDVATAPKQLYEVITDEKARDEFKKELMEFIEGFDFRRDPLTAAAQWGGLVGALVGGKLAGKITQNLRYVSPEELGINLRVEGPSTLRVPVETPPEAIEASFIDDVVRKLIKDYNAGKIGKEEFLRKLNKLLEEYKKEGGEKPENIYVWHATSSNIPSEFAVLPGHSPTPGLYVSPEPYPAFAVRGVLDLPFHERLSLLLSRTKGSKPQLLKLEVKDVVLPEPGEKTPANAEWRFRIEPGVTDVENFERYIGYVLENRGNPIAIVSPEVQAKLPWRGQLEVEAVVPPDTLFRESLYSRIVKPFTEVEVPKYKPAEKIVKVFNSPDEAAEYASQLRRQGYIVYEGKTVTGKPKVIAYKPEATGEWEKVRLNIREFKPKSAGKVEAAEPETVEATRPPDYRAAEATSRERQQFVTTSRDVLADGVEATATIGALARNAADIADRINAEDLAPRSPQIIDSRGTAPPGLPERTRYVDIPVSVKVMRESAAIDSAIRVETSLAARESVRLAQLVREHERTLPVRHHKVLHEQRYTLVSVEVPRAERTASVLKRHVRERTVVLPWRVSRLETARRLQEVTLRRETSTTRSVKLEPRYVEKTVDMPVKKHEIAYGKSLDVAALDTPVSGEQRGEVVVIPITRTVEIVVPRYDVVDIQVTREEPVPRRREPSRGRGMDVSGGAIPAQPGMPALAPVPMPAGWRPPPRRLQYEMLVL